MGKIRARTVLETGRARLCAVYDKAPDSSGVEVGISSTAAFASSQDFLRQGRLFADLSTMSEALSV